MSPQKPTPEHNDDHEFVKFIAKHRWSVITHRCRCEDPATFDEWPEHIAAELKEAGFEITKRSELGVTKGLPGIADDLTGFLDRVLTQNHDRLLRSVREGEKELEDRALAAALDLIGRRTDIVAVQLPEPDEHSNGVWSGPGEWLAYTDSSGTRVRVTSPNDDLYEFTPDAARQLVANVLAAALLAAANVADAAEDGGK